MKYFILIFALFSACLQADELQVKIETRDQNGNGKPDRFTTNSFEKGVMVRSEMTSDRDEDGRPEFSYVRLYSEGQTVYFESIDNRLNVRMQVYFTDGKPMLYKLSLDSDDHYEWTLIKNSDTEEITILHFEKNGAVRLATEAEMKRVGPLTKVNPN